MNLRATTLAVMFAVSLPAAAGGGGTPGGIATEITQLANNAQLIAQVAEASRQTATQLAQLDTMIRNLNPLQALSMMQSGMAGDIGKIVAASVKTAEDIKHVYSVMQGLHKEATALSGTAWSAYAMIRPVLQSIERHKIGLGDKEKPMSSAELYKMLDEAIAKVPKAERDAALTVNGRVMSSSEYLRILNNHLNGVSIGTNRLLEQSSQINGITGNLQGLQFIAAQNVGIQASIKELTSTIIQLEMVREQREAEKLSREAVRGIESKRRLQEKYNNMRIGI